MDKRYKTSNNLTTTVNEKKSKTNVYSTFTCNWYMYMRYIVKLYKMKNNKKNNIQKMFLLFMWNDM